MRLLRHAVALAVSAVVVCATMGLDWVAGVYLGGALVLYRGARHIRPRPHRFVFARR